MGDTFELCKIIDDLKNSAFYRNLLKEIKDHNEASSFLGINSLEIQHCFIKNDYEALRRIVKICTKVSPSHMTSATIKYKVWFYEASGRISL